MPINEALPRRTKMTLDQLDEEFARVRATSGPEGVAPGATWEEPELPADADSAAVAAWLEKHPKSFWGRRRLAARLVAEEKWPQAKEVLRDAQGALSGICRAGERLRAAGHRLPADGPTRPPSTRSSRSWRRATATPVPAYLRLMELDEAAGDWHGRGQERAAAPGGQSADPGAAPPARPRRGAARRARRGDRPPTAPWRCSTTPTRPRCITAWRKLLQPGGQAATRPAARSSSRSRRPRGSSTPIRLLLELVEPGKPATRHAPAVRRPDPRGRQRHDATTPDPGRDPVPAGDRRRRGPGASRAGPGGGAPCRSTAPRRPRRRARLEGRRAVQERRLHVRPGRVRLGRLRRRGGGGGCGGCGWGGGGWATDWPDSDLNFSFRLQQLTSLKVNPDPIIAAADRRAAVRLSVPLHDRAGRAARSRRRRSWRCGATCSTAAS